MSTQLSDSDKVKRAFELYKKLQEERAKGFFITLSVAGYLWQIKEEGLYRFLGDHIKTFDDFCLEVNMSVRKAEYLIKNFDIFILKFKKKPAELEGVDMTNLRIIAPYCNEENIDELIASARILTARKLESHLRTQNKTLSELAECPHDYVYAVKRYCKICGIWEQKETNDKGIVNRFDQTKKKHVKNVFIDEIIDYFKEQMGLKKIDGSDKENRRYALLCLKKVKGEMNAGNEMKTLKTIIDIASKDNFYSGATTSFRFLWHNLIRIAKLSQIKKTTTVI